MAVEKLENSGNFFLLLCGHPVCPLSKLCYHWWHNTFQSQTQDKPFLCCFRHLLFLLLTFYQFVYSGDVMLNLCPCLICALEMMMMIIKLSCCTLSLVSTEMGERLWVYHLSGLWPVIQANLASYPQWDRKWVLVKVHWCCGAAYSICVLNLWWLVKYSDHVLTDAGLNDYHIQCTTQRWRGGATGRALDLRSVGLGFKSYSGQRCVTTLGKLFTPMCLCHQAL